MVKSMFLLSVFCICSFAFAADVTITATDNGNGTITIGYDGAGAGVRGIALKVTVAGGAVQGVVAGASTFNVFMDAAFVVQTDGDDNTNYFIGDGNSIANPDGPGTIALPASVVSLSAGYVDQGETQAPAPDTGVVDLIAVSGEGACITIALDELRGGVVGDAVENVILPEELCLGGGVCAGDITGNKDGMELVPGTWDLIWMPDIGMDAPDGDVDLVDLACMVNILVNEGGSNYIVDNPEKIAEFATADVTGGKDGMELDPNIWELIWTGKLDAPNGVINLTDLAAVVNILVNEGGPEYNAPCPWK